MNSKREYVERIRAGNDKNVAIKVQLRKPALLNREQSRQDMLIASVWVNGMLVERNTSPLNRIGGRKGR